MIISESSFKGFVEGESKSFEIIFRQYYRTLVLFAMRYKLESMEAEDLVIETMHHIWEIRLRVKSPAALHSLLFTSIHNRALNVIRNQKNRERIINEKLEFTEEEELREHVTEEEVSSALNRAVDALPPQCRQVVLLLLAGKSVLDIAKHMGISDNSVKTYKLRAIEILRVVLKNHAFLFWLITFRIKD